MAATRVDEWSEKRRKSVCSLEETLPKGSYGRGALRHFIVVGYVHLGERPSMVGQNFA